MSHPALRLAAACLLVLAAVPLAPVRAAPSPHPAAHSHGRPPGTGPKRIGKFEDWQAATHSEGGSQVCYAFTRPSGSTPALPGRGDVVLTVTKRPGGRDDVALAAGFAYPPSAEVEFSAEGVTLPFYTAGRSAFAHDGRAALALFARGSRTQARSPSPRGQAVVDTFSLRGFTQAYSAIVKACASR